MIMNQEDIDERLRNSKVGEEIILDVRLSDLYKGIKIIRMCRYIKFMIHTTIEIELDIDPSDPKTLDDKYILFSTDNERKYYQELTVKDDKIEGDKKVTLEFDRIDEKLNYSLKVDLGVDGHYFAFTNIPYADLVYEPTGSETYPCEPGSYWFRLER